MTKLPTTGPLPKPKSPDEAREVLKAEAFPAPDAQRNFTDAGRRLIKNEGEPHVS